MKKFTPKSIKILKKMEPRLKIETKAVTKKQQQEAMNGITKEVKYDIQGSEARRPERWSAIERRSLRDLMKKRRGGRETVESSY